MPGVNTVFGPIHPEQMGFIGIFETILWGAPGWTNDPAACKELPQVFSRWNIELTRYKSIGGQTVLVQSGPDLRPQLELFRLLSRSSGVHIVLSTGFDASTGTGVDGLADADYLAESYVKELTQGIGETKIRAGALRVDWRKGTKRQREVVLRGAARAAKKTGHAMMVGGFGALADTLDVLKQEGVEPDRVVIAHRDNAASLSLEQDKKLCRKGFNVAYDRVGTEPTWSSASWAISDYVRADMVQGLASEGFVKQVIVAAGTVGGQGDKGCGPHLGVSAAGSLKHFLAKLHRLRMKDEQINTLLVDNPKRILSVP